MRWLDQGTGHAVKMPLFFLFVLLVTSQTFISGYRLDPVDELPVRSLLQITRGCSEDFENKNYTVVTSKCKGPRYSKEDCCNALKEFACPYADLINDEKTNCASIMFSYITVLGKYPPGLFANICSEDKHGLACPDNITTQHALQKSSGVVSVSIHHSSVSVFSVITMIIHLFYFKF